MTPSATPPANDEGLRSACAEAVQELKAARDLIAGQSAQIEQANKLLALQSEIEKGLRDINALGVQERGDLYKALDAKNRAIAALEAQVKKKGGGGFWGKVKLGVFAAAIGVIAGAVL